jgi:hypothetical protein
VPLTVAITAPRPGVTPVTTPVESTATAAELFEPQSTAYRALTRPDTSYTWAVTRNDSPGARCSSGPPAPTISTRSTASGSTRPGRASSQAGKPTTKNTESSRNERRRLIRVLTLNSGFRPLNGVRDLYSAAHPRQLASSARVAQEWTSCDHAVRISDSHRTPRSDSRGTTDGKRPKRCLVEMQM